MITPTIQDYYKHNLLHAISLRNDHAKINMTTPTTEHLLAMYAQFIYNR